MHNSQSPFIKISAFNNDKEDDIDIDIGSDIASTIHIYNDNGVQFTIGLFAAFAFIKKKRMTLTVTLTLTITLALSLTSTLILHRQLTFTMTVTYNSQSPFL